jgi:DNA-binding transcriptional regulator YiaG
MAYAYDTFTHRSEFSNEDLVTLRAEVLSADQMLIYDEWPSEQTKLALKEIVHKIISADLRSRDAASSVELERYAAIVSEQLNESGNDTAYDNLRLGLSTIADLITQLQELAPLRQSSAETLSRLNALLGVAQSDLAELLGTNIRSLQRWMAAESLPRPPEAQRLSLVATLAEKLVRAYTGPGVVEWFHRDRPQLNGAKPVDLLDDIEEYPSLMALAGATSGTFAS